MTWHPSHGDDHKKYSFAFINTFKIWKRVSTEKVDDKTMIVTTTFGFNPNGLIWFASEQQILKFLSV